MLGLSLTLHFRENIPRIAVRTDETRVRHLVRSIVALFPFKITIKTGIVHFVPVRGSTSGKLVGALAVEVVVLAGRTEPGVEDSENLFGHMVSLGRHHNSYPRYPQSPVRQDPR